LAKEMTTAPGIRRAARWGFLVMGGVLLFWLPIEDTNLAGVQIMALTLCLLAGIHYSKEISARNGIIPLTLYGLAIGSLAVPLAIFLMIMKNGLHGHATSDYSFADIREIFRLAPYWGFAGALIGLGAWHWLRRWV